MKSGLKVFAPATVANLACGYDILGLAIDAPGDEVIVRPGNKAGLVIKSITGAKGSLSKDPEKNTAGKAALALLQHLGRTDEPIEMDIIKRMPIGTGLGSSAASAAAGVMAVNEYLRRPLQKRELLPFAVEGEAVADGAWHADNVAPSLLGGIILIRDNATLDIQRLPVPSGVHVVVLYPHIKILTAEARQILRSECPLPAVIQQSGNVAAFVAALYTFNLELLGRSLRDHLIEPQRAKLIPGFYDVQEAALKAGALGCSISGAGPSIFALCFNSLDAKAVAEAMQHAMQKTKVESTVYISKINPEGATLL